jgi:hypothetical protein
MTVRLAVSRAQVLAFRRRVAALDERQPAGPNALQHAAWAGLQDSMPRAALLSIHARVRDTPSAVLDDPSLVQIWGPRFSAYVVAAADVAVFALGRLSDSPLRRAHAFDLAARVAAFLDGRTLPFGEVGRALGVPPNELRYAAPTGTVVIHWDGARQPTISSVPAPEVDPEHARLELARRHVHVFGPTDKTAFAKWVGVRPAHANATFAALESELTAVRTPIGDRWILTRDEPEFHLAATAPAPARLLPSGDTYFLLQGTDRDLVVPRADQRELLWTSRVWPGAVLVKGEIVGTWRRANAVLTIEPWRRLTRADRDAVEAEAQSLPLPGVANITVHWRL